MTIDIERAIKEFLNIFSDVTKESIDLGGLMNHLDKLAYLAGVVSYEFDEAEYRDAPQRDYQSIRQNIESVLPNIGLYNSLEHVSDKLGDTNIRTGDAVDDLADIVGDLEEVLWYFNNTSSSNASWHFKNSFTSHWGRHLRELQLCLHDQWW